MAAASEPQQTTEPRYATCGASLRGDRKCSKPTGWGTTHPGSGRCKFHGGSSPTGIIHAAKLEAIQLGQELNMEPHDALLLTVRRAAMWERFCADRVGRLNETDLVLRHVREREWIGNGESGAGGGAEKITEAHSDLNIWLREHQKSLDQLARLAKTAIDAGVSERRIRIEEQWADGIANLLDGVLSDLGVKNHPEAPDVIRRHLRLVEAGPGTLAA